MEDTSNLTSHIFIMGRIKDGKATNAPLYVFSFRLIAPHYENIKNIPDRLRFCRHRFGLMQKEVAKILGISRIMYANIENGSVNSIDKNIADKLAKLFRIPVNDIMDDYSLFIAIGQGKLIHDYMKSKNMGKRPFARFIGVDPNLLRLWESEKKQISLKSWEKYFKNAINLQK